MVLRHDILSEYWHGESSIETSEKKSRHMGAGVIPAYLFLFWKTHVVYFEIRLILSLLLSCPTTWAILKNEVGISK